MLRLRERFSAKKRGSDHLVRAVTPTRDRRLEAAIADDQIDIHFQPQIDPLNKRVVGVEALARWPDVPNPQALFARALKAG
ncbi:MAG: hypothetical protein M3R03_05595, partial [Pseudomonadota bacterium]|nr:hypothetical protein [Pseudomonadota bacterium]